MAFDFSNYISRSVSVIALSSLLMADSVFAQGAEEDEIIVTARKQETTILDSPLSITALTDVEIKAAGLEDIVDLSKSAPGLFIEPINALNARVQTQPRFRGITFEAQSPLQRTATVFVDGILTSGGLQSLGFNEVERVEIIKGPQSALFGRNTFSGAINYITKDPSQESGGSVSVLAATRDEYRVNASIEGGLGDIVSARVSGGYNFDGGHYNNAVAPEQELGEETDWNINGTVLFEPTENFRLKLRGGYYQTDDGPAAVQRVAGFTEHNFGGFDVPGGGQTETAFRGTVRTPGNDEIGLSTSDAEYQLFIDTLLADPRAGVNGENVTSLGLDLRDLGGFGAETEGFRLSADASFELSDNLSLDVLAGYNEDEFLVLQDFDSSAGGSLPLPPLFPPFSFFFSFPTDFDPSTGGSFASTGGQLVEDLSLEARLSGQLLDDRLKWSVGANYVDIQVAGVGGFLDQLDGAFFGGIFEDPSATSAETFGVFGTLDVAITDELTIIGEARYQEDEISDASVGDFSPTTFDSFLPRLLVQYEPSSTTTLYANYSEGNLPGGFNDEVAELSADQTTEFNDLVPGVGVSFNEETLTNYELGWKQVAFDGDFAFNLAAFYMERSDQLYSGFEIVSDPGTNNMMRTVAFTANGATTDIFGIEWDGTVQATNNLTLQGSLAWIDASIASFPEVDNAGDFTAVFGAGADPTGQVAPRFPEWSGSLAISHEQELSSGALGEDTTWYSRGDLFYTGSFFDENTNLAETPDAVDVNLRTGLRFGNYSVEVFVSNLFEEDTVAAANNIADTSLDVRLRTQGGFSLFDFSQESVHVALRDRRQFGVRVQADF